jgi:hypothetical protein
VVIQGNKKGNNQQNGRGIRSNFNLGLNKLVLNFNNIMQFIKLRQSYNLTNGLLDLIEYINKYSDTKKMSLVEIGSYLGESTVIFAQNFAGVSSIDPFLGNYDVDDFIGSRGDDEFNLFYEKFKENISNYTNISHFKMRSDDFKSESKFDVVYIDGEHTPDQVRKDIINFLPMIKIGGFISGHDYYEDNGFVKDVVNDIFGKPDMIFQDYSWIKKK